jgi:4-hydroxyphenylpyruvate dioxygenase-like putative hemolysin
MADLFDNPMRRVGFEFVEFASLRIEHDRTHLRTDGLHAGGAASLDGFGEGNFKALFESLERDQVERGLLAMTH